MDERRRPLWARARHCVLCGGSEAAIDLPDKVHHAVPARRSGGLVAKTSCNPNHLAHGGGTKRVQGGGELVLGRGEAGTVDHARVIISDTAADVANCSSCIILVEVPGK